jgi:hypothetical protein
VAIWNTSSGYTTGWAKMTKITNVRLPNAAQGEYSPQQFDQLVRSLEQIVLQLNASYTPIVTQQNANKRAWYEG